MRDTKIVATLGPASSSPEILREMILAGVNVVRINFSHGSAQEHIDRVNNVRALANELGVHIGVLADLQGPKIRISKFAEKSVMLTNGSSFVFDKQADVPGDINRVGLDFPDLIKDIERGDILLLDDGKIRMRVEKNTGDELECIVEQGGKLSDRKGINKLGGGLSAAALTAKDMADIITAAQFQADFLAVSFPKSTADMSMARELMRNAGGDALLIAKIERAEAIPNLVEILEASDGLMVARGDLAVEVGDAKVRVSCIGPAGEQLSKIAAIMNDKDRAAGRSGVGAVMGSKNLKAVVVRGSQTIDIDEKEKFQEIVRAKNKKVKEDGVAGEGLPKLGTKVLDNIINQGGLYPTNNFQFATFKDVAEVCGEALVEKKYLKKNKACFSCPIACARVVELPDGSKGEGPEYESGWSFGADCGVKDLFAIVKANFLCNELGLDTISAGCTIAAAMELYEKGYIPKEDLENGPELVFGSSEAVVYYTQKMGRCEGKLGKLMAEGSYRLAEAYGHPELAMVVKKQELPAYDPRGVQGHGLQYATSNRGGCHVRGYMISPEVLGYPQKLDMQVLEGKPQWVKTLQDLNAVIDALGFCLFSSFPFGGDDYSELLNAATGFGMTTEEMMRVGERIWNLERQFNMAAGITPAEDTLPPRLLNEPLADGSQKGATSKLKELLPLYYKIRGWDERGYIPAAKIQELGL